MMKFLGVKLGVASLCLGAAEACHNFRAAL